MDLQRRGPGKHAGYVCDVTDRAHVFEIAARTAEAVAPIDVLVNNAGVVSGKWLTELTEADIRRTFEVNTLAHYWTVQATLPAMIERGRGHIVTIASASAIVGVAKLTDYAASKSAAFAFDESLRVELRRLKSPVKTTVVCPFYIDTGMFKGVKSRLGPLLPILKEEKVAAAVIRAVERDKARLYLPPTVIAGHLMRWLPVSAYDAWNDALGVNRSMDDFVGRGSTVRS
jgi:all-trans-retinol dehydrogenase (NAD+)